MVGQPGRVAAAAAGPGRRAPTWLVRVLGGRTALQGAVVSRIGSPDDRRRALRAGAVVDVLHGASMVAAAALMPPYRRSATISATVAFSSAAAGLAAAR